MVFYRVMVLEGISTRPVSRWLRTLWYARRLLRDYEMRHAPRDIWIESCTQLEFVLD